MQKIVSEKTFEINEHLSVALRQGETIVLVCGRPFRQCKYLAFSFPAEQARSYDSVQSIDDLERLDRSKQYGTLDIDPETEFWGHCSNLQAWAERGYDTRLLHRNLAFPLLKKLSEAGDTAAKRAFKDEVARRFSSGSLSVVEYLLEEGYLEMFKPEELDSLFANFEYGPIMALELDERLFCLERLAKTGAPAAMIEFKQELFRVLDEGSKEDVKLLFDRAFTVYFSRDQIVGLAPALGLASNALLTWGCAKGAPWDFYWCDTGTEERLGLATWGAINRAPSGFFRRFETVLENIELSKTAVRLGASRCFFERLPELLTNKSLARWGAFHRAPKAFYEDFAVISTNPALAKWGVLNRVGPSFWTNFSTLSEKMDYHGWKRDPSDLGGALRGYGAILGEKKRLDEAMGLYLDAILVHEWLDDLEELALDLNHVGVLMVEKGDLDEALKYHRWALELHQGQGNLTLEALDLENLGDVLVTKRDGAGARTWFEKALAVLERTGDLSRKGKCQFKLASISFEEGKIDEAIERCQESLKISERLGDLAGVKTNLKCIGIALERKGEFEQAQIYHERLEELLEEGEEFSIKL